MVRPGDLAALESGGAARGAQREMAEPPKGKWRRGDRTHHRRTFESVHDEEAFACVVESGTDIRETGRIA